MIKITGCTDNDPLCLVGLEVSSDTSMFTYIKKLHKLAMPKEFTINE